jgi:RNA polymerase sigma-70 factor (ECF subfamily)
VIRLTAQEQRRRRWIQLRWLDRQSAAGPEAPDPAPDPAEQTVSADNQWRLGMALARLSRRQQEMMHLVFYQGLSIQEAGMVLGIPVGTARTHYERGKLRLRRLLAEMEGQ